MRNLLTVMVAESGFNRSGTLFHDTFVRGKNILNGLSGQIRLVWTRRGEDVGWSKEMFKVVAAGELFLSSWKILKRLSLKTPQQEVFYFIFNHSINTKSLASYRQVRFIMFVLISLLAHGGAFFFLIVCITAEEKGVTFFGFQKLFGYIYT